MGKRRRLATAKTIAQRIKEGRGANEGAEYKPWLTIQDVPSLGRVHRIKGWKHGRVHHLLSDLEANIFYIYEWTPEIIDIREQYALLPLEETLSIAKYLGVRHPTDPWNGYPVVMTTDLFLTIHCNQHSTYEPRTAKYKKDLEKRRNLEKLEIERLFWKNRSLDLKVATEDSVPQPLCENVKWVHPYLRLADLYPLSEDAINEISFVLTQMIFKDKNAPLRQITAACDGLLKLPRGESLAVVRHLLANRWWLVDMTKLIRQGEPLILLNKPKAALYGERRLVAWN